MAAGSVAVIGTYLAVAGLPLWGYMIWIGISVLITLRFDALAA
jgi:hypothetical protein